MLDTNEDIVRSTMTENLLRSIGTSLIDSDKTDSVHSELTELSIESGSCEVDQYQLGIFRVKAKQRSMLVQETD